MYSGQLCNAHVKYMVKIAPYYMIFEKKNADQLTSFSELKSASDCSIVN
jgi:hypothetical protein